MAVIDLIPTFRTKFLEFPETYIDDTYLAYFLEQAEMYVTYIEGNKLLTCAILNITAHLIALRWLPSGSDDGLGTVTINNQLNLVDYQRSVGEVSSTSVQPLLQEGSTLAEFLLTTEYGRLAKICLDKMIGARMFLFDI